MLQPNVLYFHWLKKCIKNGRTYLLPRAVVRVNSALRPGQSDVITVAGFFRWYQSRLLKVKNCPSLQSGPQHWGLALIFRVFIHFGKIEVTETISLCRGNSPKFEITGTKTRLIEKLIHYNLNLPQTKLQISINVHRVYQPKSSRLPFFDRRDKFETSNSRISKS